MDTDLGSDQNGNTDLPHIKVWEENIENIPVEGGEPKNPPIDDSDWLIKIARKRKSFEMNEFRNFESSQAHLNDSFSENRRTKLCEEAVRALAVLDEAIRVDSVLERTFSYLSSQELKRLSRVDTLWRNVAVKVLRKRSGNAPFILYWKTPVLEDEPDSFQEMLRSYFCSPWLSGDCKNVLPVKTIISFGSINFILGTSDFQAIGDNFNFIYGASRCVVAGLTGGNSRTVETSDEKVFSLQTICIPEDPTIDFVTMAIPVWSADTYAIVCENLGTAHFETRENLKNAGKSVKGLLILTYFEDSLSQAFAESYSTSSPEVGIIGANVEGIACSDVPNRTAVASIVAIHGMPNVCVGTYGFTVTEENVIAFINLANLFFGDAKKKLAIMVYRLLFGEVYLKSLTAGIGDVPTIGIETCDPIQFKGVYVDTRFPPTFLDVRNAPADNRVQMAIFLVKY